MRPQAVAAPFQPRESLSLSPLPTPSDTGLAQSHREGRRGAGRAKGSDRARASASGGHSYIRASPPLPALQGPLDTLRAIISRRCLLLFPGLWDTWGTRPPRLL